MFDQAKVGFARIMDIVFVWLIYCRLLVFGAAGVTLVLNTLTDFLSSSIGAMLLKTLDFLNLWPSQSTSVSSSVLLDLL
jgi:hypothetical protein